MDNLSEKQKKELINSFKKAVKDFVKEEKELEKIEKLQKEKELEKKIKDEEYMSDNFLMQLVVEILEGSTYNHDQLKNILKNRSPEILNEINLLVDYINQKIFSLNSKKLIT